MPLKVNKRDGTCWARGVVRSRAVRQSLLTRNAEVAHRRAGEMELGMDNGLVPLSCAEFRRRFTANYHGDTRERYDPFLEALEAFLEARLRSFFHEARSLDLEEFLHRHPRHRPGQPAA